MKCAYCEAAIDDDSLFCDQCGEEILLCSECRKPGKGKRCIFDGKPLVPAKQAGEGTEAATSAAPGATTVLEAPIGTGGGRATGAEPEAGAPLQGEALILVSRADGRELPIQDGTIVGRKVGSLTEFFSQFDTVSSTHARFERRPEGWSVTDLGSTNGTFVNGRALSADVPTPIQYGSVLGIADVEFGIRVEGAESATSPDGTVRIRS